MPASYTPQKVHEILKYQREQKRASLQAIHQETKISMVYLEALETGNWKAFPAEVYCLGFLRRYSSYLGLNPEEMVSLYRKEMDAVKAGQAENEKRAQHEEKQQKSSHIAKGMFLVLLIGVLGGWWLYTVIQTPPAEHKRNLPELEKIKRRVKAPGLVHVEELTLKVESASAVWMRVAADGRLQFEGFVARGSSRAWTAKDEFQVRIGNVRSVRLLLNDRPIDPRPGSVQEVNEITLNRQTLESSPEPGVDESSGTPDGLGAPRASEPKGPS